MPAAKAEPARLAGSGESAEPPEVSVVIVTWNSGEELLDCLASLHEHPPSVTWEAIVVDNGSTDGSIEAVRSRFPRASVIVNRRNRGLAAANNQGVAASRAPFVLISNPDVIYTAGAIDALLDLMARRERAAFAVARLRDRDGRLQTAAGDLPGALESLTGPLVGRRLASRSPARTRGVWWHGWSHDQERQIGHGAEACYLVRRRAIGEIGVQDERFVLDWEGLEWSRRAGEAGWEVWFAPGATVIHIGGVSLRQVPGRWIASTHLGMYRYLRPEVRPALRPPLALLIGLRALIKLAVVAVGAPVYDLAHRGGA